MKQIKNTNKTSITGLRCPFGWRTYKECGGVPMEANKNYNFGHLCVRVCENSLKMKKKTEMGGNIDTEGLSRREISALDC